MTDQVTKKYCPECKRETSHWVGSGSCATCDELEGLELLENTQAAKKAAKKKRTAERKRKRAAALPPEEQVAKRAAKIASEKEKARKELARRELAKRNLLAFVKRYESTYLAGWVHKVICEELMEFSRAVCAGESPRLMITMPPRHGKSLLASQYFPAWHMGHHPEHEIISTSYAQSLQMDFSRKIQELVRSKDFALLFPGLGIMKNNEAVERWGLAKDGSRTGGGLLAAGVGGPITGRGAHILIIDDPVKNREEADSETVREQAKGWYSSTAYTRLAPGGGVLIIQTRWHDDDLSGWLLNEMAEAQKEMNEEGEWPEDADKWRVVDFPAIAKHNEKYRRQGEALHEDRYPIRALRKIKRTLSPRDWAALYQQDPQVEEGAYFQKKHLRYYAGSAPPYMDIYAAGDLAITKKDYSNWTVFIVAGVDEHENVYILEEFRGRWNSDEIIDTMFEIQRRHHPRLFAIEKGQISLTMDSLLSRRIREERMYELAYQEMPPGKADKQLRARSFQGLMSMGKVFWPQGALWVDEHTNELLRFPTGVNDDRVDADAWLGKIVVDQPYIGSDRPKKKREQSWKKKLAGYVSGRSSDKDAMAA